MNTIPGMWRPFGIVLLNTSDLNLMNPILPFPNVSTLCTSILFTRSPESTFFVQLIKFGD